MNKAAAMLSSSDICSGASYEGTDGPLATENDGMLIETKEADSGSKRAQSALKNQNVRSSYLVASELNAKTPPKDQ